MSPAASRRLVFLKLGGSLITDKHTPHTARPDILARLAEEIAAALAEDPCLHLLIGHGSGSFGHIPARQFATRQGVHTPAQWSGFAAVWREAAALNRLVLDALLAAGLPAIAFPPSAALLAQDGGIAAWNLRPLRCALAASLLPVVYGDVVFDIRRGGTILSTEDLFTHLAYKLRPQRILLAGSDAGVWADYPACTRLVGRITPATFPEIRAALGGSAAADVTGGMASKVQQMVELAAARPRLEVAIFSGAQPGLVYQALRWQIPLPGTRVSSA